MKQTEFNDMKIKHEQLEKEARMLEDQLENEFEKLKVA